MIPYPAFWLLCCNSFVYSFSAAWVEHGKIFLSTKEPPALKEESIFYLNQSNKIKPASLSLSPPNVHILSSSYGTVEPPYRKQLIFSSQHLPAFLIVHMGCKNNPSTANQEVTAPAWENSDRKQQHKQDFPKVRSALSPAGVWKIFQKGQQKRKSKCLVWHSHNLVPRVCEGQCAQAGSRVGCSNYWKMPAVVGRVQGSLGKHAWSHFGTPLHRRTGLHVEGLDSAKVAWILQSRNGIHNHINYSHRKIMWE